MGSLFQLTLTDPDYATPYSQQWNLSVERTLAGFVLTAGYVGTKGTRLPGAQVLSTVVFAPGANARNTDARRPNGRRLARC
jgi:hypothetical protein